MNKSFGFRLSALLVFTALVAALVSPNNHNESSLAKIQEKIPVELRRRADDPADFGWIKRWSAIGDSFTAGIGAGKIVEGRHTGKLTHVDCSRYDGSYPKLVEQALGPGPDRFDFVACSGDRTLQIHDQALFLEPEQDLVIMTAGGNDLCLAMMIKKCVFLPFDGEAACQRVIDKASENLEAILKPNIVSVLDTLNVRMAKNSVVIYSGYGQFFNTENDRCTNDEDWTIEALSWWKIWPIYDRPLKLTIERRKKFNELVSRINRLIESVIDEANKNGKYKFKLGFSNWDGWAQQQAVRGQYCDPGSTGMYPDPEQPNLQFFKRSTRAPDRQGHDPDNLKKRWDGYTEEEIKMIEDQVRGTMPGEDDWYESLLYKSPNPRAVATKKLDPRAPSPPSCPGDDAWIDPTLGMGMPDSFGKNFHPNTLGHVTIASFVLENIIEQRAKVLGVGAPACVIQDKFTCWKGEGSRKYASAKFLDENYKDFCNNKVKQPPNEAGWRFETTYFKDTPEEHTFIIDLENAREFHRDSCLDSFSRLIHGCDGGPENPMNWKFGGRYVRGEYTYELNIKRERTWPMLKEPIGTCGSVDNWILFFPVWSSFVIHGAGWAGYDWGQKTLLDSAKWCLGLGVTMWRFDYFDKPDANGMEWKAEFNTPILVKDRCFNNEAVAIHAGGHHKSIHSNENWGCGFF